jgi:hypothetical protein
MSMRRGAGVAGITASPQLQARLTGALYLCIMVLAFFSEMFVQSKLVASGNPALTVRNIASAESLYRLGVAANVATVVLDVAVAALLYALLRPVSRGVALASALFRVAYAGAMTVAAAFLAAPLSWLPRGANARAVSSDVALGATAYSLNLHDVVFVAALALFGVHCVLLGWLIFESTFLPRVLGMLLALAGACYVLNTFAHFIAPALAADLFPWVLLPGFVAEAGLTLWLLIAGVNAERWRRQDGLDS